MIAQILKCYTRHYSDNGQITSYVEWRDRLGRTGRTEGDADGPHMAALIARAAREGVPLQTERW